MQLPMFETGSGWRAPRLSELPTDWNRAKRIGLDCETCDPHLKTLGLSVRRGGFIAGISFAMEDGPSYYLPLRHKGGDNMVEGPEAVLQYIREQAHAFTGEIVGANLPYDLDYLAEVGVHFPNIKYFRDVQIADPVINELHMSYSLHNIALRHGLPGKDENLLRIAAAEYGIDPKKDMWQLPARYVGPYAEVDAVRPLQILRKQERMIDELDLWKIYNLESKVLPVLVKMRRRGVLIDQDRLTRIEDWSLEQEAGALRKVKVHTGCNIAVGDVWKAGAIAPALEAIGITLKKTTTGAPSIDKDVLSRIDHPVAKALGWARKTNKLRTTFAASVRRYMVDGRIHCSFKQMAQEDEDGTQKGARYGRLSCVEPNLQQQPSRDEFANEWRSIYIPDEGGEWATLDYSQQEPRWTTHFAAIMNLPGAKAAAQAYHDNPKLDNHQFMADITGLPRKAAKNIYLGLCYGEGGAKLCRELGLPTRWAVSYGKGRERRTEYRDDEESAKQLRREVGDGFIYAAAGPEGQKILDTFDARAPFIRQLAKAASKVASSRGYITTGGGRRLHFPEREDGTFDWTHKGLNRLIQGTSADQAKASLVALDEAGVPLQLQVHDDFNFSCYERKQAFMASEIMQNVMPALVPFRVDVEIGPSWGEIKEP